MYTNPLLGLWLSSMNTLLSVARHQAMREQRRYANAMMSEATRQTFRFWSGALGLDPPKQTARRRRRSRR